MKLKKYVTIIHTYVTSHVGKIFHNLGLYYWRQFHDLKFKKIIFGIFLRLKCCQCTLHISEEVHASSTQSFNVVCSQIRSEIQDIWYFYYSHASAVAVRRPLFIGWTDTQCFEYREMLFGRSATVMLPCSGGTLISYCCPMIHWSIPRKQNFTRAIS